MQIVLADIGTTKTRLGFQGDYKPNIVLPSLYGKPRHQGVKAGLDPNVKFYGDQLAYKKQLLKPHAILNRSLIENFDDFYDFTRFCIYDELRLDPSDVQVFFSCNFQTSRENKAKISQIMFEQFNVKGFFILNSLILSMYSSGSLTGLAVEVGDSYQQVCPVYQGFLLNHSFRQNIFAGKDISAQLVQLIKSYNKEFNEDADLIGVIKQTLLTYNTSQFCDQEEVLYQLPDGFLLNNQKCQNIMFNRQKLLDLPEQLFDQDNGMQALIFDSITATDEDLRGEMAGNIVLAGGTTMIKGLPEHLQDVLGKDYNIALPEDREDACFCGMSVLSSLPTFKDMIITPSMWNEYGDDVVSLKWL